MAFIDTHCHLNMEEFADDLEKVLDKADKAGVKKIIDIGCDLKSAKKSIELSRKYDNVFSVIGIHPGEIKNYEKALTDFESIKEMAKDKKVVGIGEIGLDYKGLESDEETKIRQKEFFLRFLSLAEELNKPVAIHCRGAYDDLIKILSGYKNEGGKFKGVVHCFSGRLSQAKKLLDLGLFVSFTGIITYARDYDNLIKKIPLEKILLETDAPFLAPVPFRGKRNEPAFVVEVAKKIAEIKEVSLEEVAEKTTQNVNQLFGLS